MEKITYFREADMTVKQTNKPNNLKQQQNKAQQTPLLTASKATHELQMQPPQVAQLLESRNIFQNENK